MKAKLIFSIVLLFAVMAGLVALAFSGILPTPATKPFSAQAAPGIFSAVSFSQLESDALPAAKSEAEVADILEKAKSGGANAILFLSHWDKTAFYQSKYFTPATTEYDPLLDLCKKANAEGIAVFALYDVLTDRLPAGSFAERLYFPFLELFGESGFEKFGLTEKRNAWLLEQDIRALVHDYPVAGVVFYAGQSSSKDAIFSLADAVHAAQSDTLTAVWGNSGLFAVEDISDLSKNDIDIFIPALTDDLLAQPQAAELVKSHAVWGDFSQVSDVAFDRFAADGLAGAVIGTTKDDVLSLSLRSTLLPGLETKTISQPQTLAVGFPAADTESTAENILFLGTSDRSVPLLLNGEEVVRSAEGSWAVWAKLEMGENVFSFAQGDTKIVRTVTRKEAKKITTTPLYPNKTLQKDLAGRAVTVTSQLAGVLPNADDDSGMTESLRAGATVRIDGTVETVRSGKIVTAYQLSGGGYLLAKHAELADEAYAVPTLAFGSIQGPADRQMTVRLTGGSPAAITEHKNNRFEILFLDTVLSADLPNLLLQNDAVAAAEVIKEESGSRLAVTFDDESALWGWDVSYEENSTVLRFTFAPTLSLENGKPLSGVRILLDAGHGDTDYGALGITGLAGGACEKDVNLALTLALKDRLTQLGASVTLTRSDDSFPSLTDRWAQANQELPDLFIALHHNSMEYVKDTNEVSGVEAYWHRTAESEAFAESLLSATALSTGRKKNFTDDSYFYVCRQTAFPSVLFEFGYLLNPGELESCLSGAGLQSAANGISRGIVDYLSS